MFLDLQVFKKNEQDLIIFIKLKNIAVCKSRLDVLCRYVNIMCRKNDKLSYTRKL